MRVRKKLLATSRAVAVAVLWLGAAEDTATLVLRTNHRGGHIGRAQVRQPVIMVGETASGPSCKKIGRRDLSRGERKAKRTYAWFRLAGYVRRRCRCNLQSLGWYDEAHSTSSCTTGERGSFASHVDLRDKRLYIHTSVPKDVSLA